MQKYIKTDLSEIRYFEDDVIVGDWIDLDEYRLMTDDEIDRHENPEKYLSDEEKLLIYRQNMPDLSRIAFKYKLHKAGKLEEVEQFIKTTDNFLLQLAYNEAQFFSRTDTLLTQALEDLGWTDEQVDEMWTS